MSVEFIPAVCPKCGGELRVPSNLDVVKCMYCGNEVILNNPNQVNVKVEYSRNINKLQQLARIAEESQNYTESYNFYSQILEVNPDNRVSWLGKARAAAKLCKATSTALDEAISYFEISLTYGNTIDNDASNTIHTIAESTRDYFGKIADYYYEEYHRNKPAAVYDPLLEIANNIETTRLYKDISSKFETKGDN